MSTPSIPGIDREALIDVIIRDPDTGPWTAHRAADAAIAYFAAHHKCACDQEHADEWVEVDVDGWEDLPESARLRTEWVRGTPAAVRRFVHRDDLPADPARKAVSDIIEGFIEGFDASLLIPMDEFFLRLRASGWDVVPKEER